MQLFGEIRQGTLPFYYIQPSTYSIRLFRLIVNQPQRIFNTLGVPYLIPSPVAMVEGEG